MTSNSSVADRVGVFSDAVVATAIPDRLLHHSYVITIRGDCYRLRTNPDRKSGPSQAVSRDWLLHEGRSCSDTS